MRTTMNASYSRVTAVFTIDDEDNDFLAAPFDEEIAQLQNDDDDDDYQHQPEVELTQVQPQEAAVYSGNSEGRQTPNLLPSEDCKQRIRPPSNYVCPLTLQLMEHPVNDGCGHSFERDAILSWLGYHEICPISRKPCHRDELYPAMALRARILQWKTLHNFRNNAMLDLSIHTDDSHTPVELMLLPQERKVLAIIKVQAKERREERQRQTVLWGIGGLLVGAVVIIACFFLKALIANVQGWT